MPHSSLQGQARSFSPALTKTAGRRHLSHPLPSSLRPPSPTSAEQSLQHPPTRAPSCPTAEPRGDPWGSGVQCSTSFRSLKRNQVCSLNPGSVLGWFSLYFQKIQSKSKEQKDCGKGRLEPTLQTRTWQRKASPRCHCFFQEKRRASPGATDPPHPRRTPLQTQKELSHRSVYQ